MPDAAITFRDLTLGYRSHPAVHHLDGQVARGSLTAVVGANGSGKSTLLKGIVGLLKPMGGAVDICAGSRIAYLPQQSELDRSFPARVVDLVSLGLWPRRGFFRRHTAEDRETVRRALAAVGLEGFEAREEIPGERAVACSDGRAHVRGRRGGMPCPFSGDKAGTCATEGDEDFVDPFVDQFPPGGDHGVEVAEVSLPLKFVAIEASELAELESIRLNDVRCAPFQLPTQLFERFVGGVDRNE